MFVFRSPINSKKIFATQKFKKNKLSFQFQQQFSTNYHSNDPPKNLIACANCKHFQSNYSTCAKFIAESLPDYNNGKYFTKHEKTRTCREDINKCGPDAVFFEHRRTGLKRILSYIGIAFGIYVFFDVTNEYYRINYIKK